MSCNQCVTEVPCTTPCNQMPVPPAYTPVTWCSGNSSFTFDGTKVIKTPYSIPVPDGVYTKVTIIDGCIVEAGLADVPSYTPLGCCDAPGGGTSPDVGEVDLSNVACNLLQNYPDGLYAGLNVVGSNGITVAGCGTPSSPLTLSFSFPVGIPQLYTASASTGNLITVNNSLYTIFAAVNVQSTPSVTFTGDGNLASPFRFKVPDGLFIQNITSNIMVVTEPIPSEFVIDHPLYGIGAAYSHETNFTFNDSGHLTAVSAMPILYPGGYTTKVPTELPTPAGFIVTTYNQYGTPIAVSFAPPIIVVP